MMCLYYFSQTPLIQQSLEIPIDRGLDSLGINSLIVDLRIESKLIFF